MTAVPPSPALRLFRLLRPGGNPLARGVDRAEAAVVVLCVLFALVLVPVMLSLGSLTYTSLAERGEQQSRARYETVAVLIEGAPEVSIGASGEVVSSPSKVAARWWMPDGTTRTGFVEAEDGLKPGDEVRVWLDAAGRPTDAPLSTVEAVGAGVVVATLGWLVAAGLLAIVCWSLHQVCDRRRYRDWETEWARTEGVVS